MAAVSPFNEHVPGLRIQHIKAFFDNDRGVLSMAKEERKHKNKPAVTLITGKAVIAECVDSNNDTTYTHMLSRHVFDMINWISCW